MGNHGMCGILWPAMGWDGAVGAEVFVGHRESQRESWSNLHYPQSYTQEAGGTL
jgi:hypothetical protein